MNILPLVTFLLITILYQVVARKPYRLVLEHLLDESYPCSSSIPERTEIFTNGGTSGCFSSDSAGEAMIQVDCDAMTGELTLREMRQCNSHPSVIAERHVSSLTCLERSWGPNVNTRACCTMSTTCESEYSSSMFLPRRRLKKKKDDDGGDGGGGDGGRGGGGNSDAEADVILAQFPEIAAFIGIGVGGLMFVLNVFGMFGITPFGRNIATLLESKETDGTASYDGRGTQTFKRETIMSTNYNSNQF